MIRLGGVAEEAVVLGAVRRGVGWCRARGWRIGWEVRAADGEGCS